MNCKACFGRGWILADNDEHGLRFERCDTCMLYPSDRIAVEVLAAKVVAWERATELAALQELTAASRRMLSATTAGYADRDEAEEGTAWEQLELAIRKAEGGVL